MTRTRNAVAIGAAAVGTAALLLGVGTLLGPEPADYLGSSPAGSTDAPTGSAAPEATSDPEPVATPEVTVPVIDAVPSGAFAAVPDGVGLASQQGADGAEIQVIVDDAPDAEWVLPLCTEGGPPPSAVDALTTVETGPEYARHWQVAVLETKADAGALLAAITAAIEGCGSTVGGVATTGLDDLSALGDLGTGDASLLAVARPAGAEQSAHSEWRSYLGAVQLDNVVVLVAESGEFFDAPALDDYGVQAAQADMSELVDGLCAEATRQCGAPGAPVP